jgi:hypothetical protein
MSVKFNFNFTIPLIICLVLGILKVKQIISVSWVIVFLPLIISIVICVVLLLLLFGRKK